MKYSYFWKILVYLDKIPIISSYYYIISGKNSCNILYFGYKFLTFGQHPQNFPVFWENLNIFWLKWYNNIPKLPEHFLKYCFNFWKKKILKYYFILGRNIYNIQLFMAKMSIWIHSNYRNIKGIFPKIIENAFLHNRMNMLPLMTGNPCKLLRNQWLPTFRDKP